MLTPKTRRAAKLGRFAAAGAAGLAWSATATAESGSAMTLGETAIVAIATAILLAGVIAIIWRAVLIIAENWAVALMVLGLSLLGWALLTLHLVAIRGDGLLESMGIAAIPTAIVLISVLCLFLDNGRGGGVGDGGSLWGDGGGDGGGGC